jgi:hypothetical protein
MTTDDIPTTVNYHALLQMKEDTMTYLWGRRKANYTRRLNGADITQVLGHAEHVSANLSIKKFKKSKNTKIPLTTLVIKQDTHMKIQKYPQMLSLCFFYF